MRCLNMALEMLIMKADIVGENKNVERMFADMLYEQYSI